VGWGDATRCGAQVTSLRRRQLLPQLMAALISGQAAAVTEHGAALLGSVHELAACCGLSAVGELPDAVSVACIADAPPAALSEPGVTLTGFPGNYKCKWSDVN